MKRPKYVLVGALVATPWLVLVVLSSNLGDVPQILGDALITVAGLALVLAGLVDRVALGGQQLHLNHLVGIAYMVGGLGLVVRTATTLDGLPLGVAALLLVVALLGGPYLLWRGWQVARDGKQVNRARPDEAS